MKGISRSIIGSIIGILLFFGDTYSQRINADTTQRTGIRIGFDITRIPLNIRFPEVHQYELTGDIGYKHYYLVTDLGFTRFNRTAAGYHYTGNGYFQRFGFDYNILPGEEVIFFGLRYGYSLMVDRLEDIKIENPYWETINPPSMATRTISGHWGEIVAGVKVSLWKNIYIGFTGRYKGRFKINYSDIPPYQLPGYGQADKDAQFGINYYIFYKIPFAPKKRIE